MYIFGKKEMQSLKSHGIVALKCSQRSLVSGNSTSFIQHGSESSNSTVKQEKEIKYIPIGIKA